MVFGQWHGASSTSSVGFVFAVRSYPKKRIEIWAVKYHRETAGRALLLSVEYCCNVTMTLYARPIGKRHCTSLITGIEPTWNVPLVSIRVWNTTLRKPSRLWRKPPDARVRITVTERRIIKFVRSSLPNRSILIKESSAEETKEVVVCLSLGSTSDQQEVSKDIYKMAVTST